MRRLAPREFNPAGKAGKLRERMPDYRRPARATGPTNEKAVTSGRSFHERGSRGVRYFIPLVGSTFAEGPPISDAASVPGGAVGSALLTVRRPRRRRLS